MSKAGIIADFNILAQMWKRGRKTKDGKIVPGKDSIRLKAYQQASTALCGVPGNTILSIKAVKKGQKRPNGNGKAAKREVYITTNEIEYFHVPKSLGAKTTEKIKEYIKTGKIKAAETAKKWLADYERDVEETPLTPEEKAIKVFRSVNGVGLATARAWLVNYKRSKASNPLEWVRKNTDKLKLNKTQLIGINPRFYHDLKKRIPRHYIHIMQIIIRLVFSKTFGFDSYTMVVCGSYRRGALDSSDIDILFKSDVFNLRQAVKALKDWGIIVETIGMGDGKFTGICHCPSGQWHYFHLDLFYSTEDEWGAQLLAWTGGAAFNRNTRAAAKKKGYTLNQYGLFNSPKDAKERRNSIAKTEKKILRMIDFPYIPPVCR